MRLTQALGKGTGLLGFGGMPKQSGRDSRALLAHALGMPADQIIVNADREITDDEMARYEALLHRRLEHEPVSRIIGRRMFWGRDFRITPHVLDPRPETETIVAEALAGSAPGTVLDLGTGSGILAVTLLAEWPGARGVASDLSPEALIVARSNAEDIGVADRLDLVEADWFEGIDGVFELIVSNPPYVTADELTDLAPEVRDFDPTLALSPGGDGLDAYRSIAARAVAHLAPGGRIMVEIGATQGPAVSALLLAAGLSDVAVLPDMDGRDRVVSAVRR